VFVIVELINLINGIVKFINQILKTMKDVSQSFFSKEAKKKKKLQRKTKHEEKMFLLHRFLEDHICFLDKY
jgi:hypothetical protein